MDTRRVLADVTHRPWPLPSGPWVMAQSWIDLLFAHWPVDAEQLRAIVPASIPIDTFDGTAWLGITPFELTGLRPRGLPALSRFPELNVRTYTMLGGKPGIWFFSLDAGSLAAVWGARLTYRLPYFKARMGIAREGRIRYRSVRAGARLEAAYEPTGPVGIP